ncbi:TMEM165/GDT1 family protein [soil metagenome]
MDLGVALTAFLLVFPAELPDKTMMATLVLATRYRPLPVFLGVCVAFAVQCVIAVAAGSLLALLPDRVVAAVVAAIFAVGAILLWRGAATAGAAEDTPSRAAQGFGRIAVLSFGVLFAAEWGDLSQLATASLAARFDDPLSVFAGSFSALVSVAALAVLLGRTIVSRLSLPAVQRGAAVLFAAFAVIAAIEAMTGTRAL